MRKALWLSVSLFVVCTLVHILLQHLGEREKTVEVRTEDSASAQNDAGADDEKGPVVASMPYNNIRDEVVKIHVLIYETEKAKKDSRAKSLVEQVAHLKGVEATLFGQGTDFEGYGSKYAAVYPILRKMSPETLVVISDGRDVLVNNPFHNDAYAFSAVDEFRAAFDELKHSHAGAIVISAEAQCCVSALTHVAPGGYFNKDGSRNSRACSSGEVGCLWAGDENATPWEEFMKDLAIELTGADYYEDVYLNAGLMTGLAGDLVKLIEATEIGKDEDDQAVLTDFLYLHPNLILLDYEQKMFGNNRGGLGGLRDGGCAFSLPKEESRLVHSMTLTTPLFIHSPGGFFECHDDLANKLGVKTTPKRKRPHLFFMNRKGCNYRENCAGDTQWSNIRGKRLRWWKRQSWWNEM
jgi:hypothetical protein